jgi:membrane protein required for colicin V production
MDSISYLDLIAATLILLLGLKGIINGFFKEFFGMTGIVGGIFIGSHVGPKLGQWVDNLIFHFENDSAIAFTGFIVVFALFWLSMTYVGVLFTKLTKKSGLGPLDKIFGFLLGAGKIFFIFAVIIYALSSINIVKKSLESFFDKSMLYPVFYAVGSVVIQIDPDSIKEKFQDEAEEQVDSLLDELTESTGE